uniref:Uncharacterized protein n=1 Tax=Rhizophagus irregularis (strain DAOM 181602 / DAOM 197198 / MUCL 43194) TaxID=747089 RepID=U9TFF3_RHIID
MRKYQSKFVYSKINKSWDASDFFWMSLEKCFVIVPLLIAERRTSHTETLSQSRTGPFVLVVSDEIRGRSSTSDDSTKNRGKIFSSKSFKSIWYIWYECQSLIHQMLYLHYDFNEALSNTTRETIKSESDDLSEAEDDGIEDAIIDAGA